MLVFIDFEASSLSDDSYPIEVGWVFEDGAGEAYLIRPAPGWDDWDPKAEAIHGIPRPHLLERGAPHAEVAQRMMSVLAGHDLFASAPSWDGKWLSALLRAAGLPRHALRLRNTDIALAETARALLSPTVPEAELGAVIKQILGSLSASDEPPAHRALADAQEERRRWLELREAAAALVAGGS